MSGRVPPAGDEIHLPGPSALPLVVTFGVTVALLGVTYSWFVVAIGLVITLLAVVRWISSTRREIDELPLDH